jgi:sporulation protein YlmC with PRC-barrel domain
MKTLQDVQTWRGMKVVDPDGDKIGTIEDIFLDRHTGEPGWAAVKTGLFGMKHTFVPLTDAEPTGGGEIRVPFQKEQVKDAPNVDPDGDLSPEDERRLWQHYGRGDYDEWQGEDRTMDLGLPEEREGRFGRSGDTGAGGETPPVVGVRLRRYVIVTAPAEPGDRS